MTEEQIQRMVNEDYQIVFFHNGYGCYTLQSSSVKNFLTKRNFREKEVDLSVGVEILIPYANHWLLIAEMFISEKTKTLFVAVEYKEEYE